MATVSDEREVTTSEALHPSQQLIVERTDISFRNIRKELVRIEIHVRNRSSFPSAKTTMRIEAAPFGVFVPWRPLTEVGVPPLRPGQSVAVETDVAAPRPQPLGDFSDVPPRKLLTAIAGGDGARRRSSFVTALFGGIGRAQAELPPDLLELLSRPNPHWAGNLNVFVDDQPVERHRAQALRVYPGRTNLAMFVVGQGPDAYRFALEGDGADWDAGLYDMTTAETLLVDRDTTCEIRETDWVETAHSNLIMLGLCPPTGCERGELQVHVTQRSTGANGQVEFSLDPQALGAGCYTI